MTRNLFLNYWEEFSKWWRMAFIIFDSIIGCRVIQDLDLCKLGDLWRHDADAKCCKITKYGISVQILSLQGWNFARLMYCKNYILWWWVCCHYSNIFVSRPLPSRNEKWKMPYLLLQSLGDFRVFVRCNVHICSHQLNERASNILSQFSQFKGRFQLILSAKSKVVNWKINMQITESPKRAKRSKGRRISLILPPLFDSGDNQVIKWYERPSFRTTLRACRHKPHCYIPRLSLSKTSIVIGWFLVTCPWSNSNV